MIKRALTIGGSDSGGGAGIQADIKTFSAFAVYGMSVLTAVTAQNSLNVNGITGIPPQFVSLQFESVLTDIGIDGVKTGMLFNAEIVQTVAQKLNENHIPLVVVDPVMRSKSGDILLENRGVDLLMEKLIPLATLLTPNIPEAEMLSGVPIRTDEDITTAAKKIHDLGCKAVLIKGGHRRGNATDILFDGVEFSKFTAPRIDTQNTHGTGCTYSAAILANLIKGKNLRDAIRLSKWFVTEAIKHAFPLGKGHGPLNHFIRIEK
ncbi:bifunctional hydroxymethylpyrimidine kinase/phosphomethylpyrimidine kinase [bacterium]|nr:bifunctional hydroxymethylpyrimidine kinase/phosphomethylpyrimidine kinase [bacterium]